MNRKLSEEKLKLWLFKKKVDSHGLCCTLGEPCVKSSNFANKKADWEENLENIELLFPLFNFEHGEIYKGCFKKKLDVTVKIFNARFQNHEQFLYRESAFNNEFSIMKSLNHEKLVRLWCVCSLNEPKLIVTEYMSNGCLLNYMRLGVGARFTIYDVINVAAQVAEGMYYLEEQKCVHRDLGTRSVYVGENGEFKSNLHEF